MIHFLCIILAVKLNFIHLFILYLFHLETFKNYIPFMKICILWITWNKTKNIHTLWDNFFCEHILSVYILTEFEENSLNIFLRLNLSCCVFHLQRWRPQNNLDDFTSHYDVYTKNMIQITKQQIGKYITEKKWLIRYLKAHMYCVHFLQIWYFDKFEIVTKGRLKTTSALSPVCCNKIQK